MSICPKSSDIVQLTEGGLMITATGQNVQLNVEEEPRPEPGRVLTQLQLMVVQIVLGRRHLRHRIVTLSRLVKVTSFLYPTSFSRFLLNYTFMVNIYIFNKSRLLSYRYHVTVIVSCTISLILRKGCYVVTNSPSSKNTSLTFIDFTRTRDILKCKL